MKKVLVTGADGFIGSHLTEELVRKGEKVKAFVYYNSFNSWGWLDSLPDEIKKRNRNIQWGYPRSEWSKESDGGSGYGFSLGGTHCDSV